MSVIIREKVENNEYVVAAVNDKVGDIVLGVSCLGAKNAPVLSDGLIRLIHISHSPGCVKSIHGHYLPGRGCAKSGQRRGITLAAQMAEFLGTRRRMRQLDCLGTGQGMQPDLPVAVPVGIAWREMVALRGIEPLSTP